MKALFILMAINLNTLILHKLGFAQGCTNPSLTLFSIFVDCLMKEIESELRNKFFLA